MSLEKTHDDVQAALAAEALDALDGEDAAQVRAHLEVCEECRRELAELREAAAALGFSAPEVPMPPERAARLRARLVARAAADRGPVAAVDAPPTAVVAPADPARQVAGVIPISRARAWPGAAGWMAAAAAVALLIAVGAYAGRLSGRYDALSGAYDALDAERITLVRAIARRDSTLAGLAGEGVRVIDLASTQRRAPSGRMFWDPKTARWTFFAHNLPDLRPGRDYQLWLITPAGPVSAGTFKTQPGGQAQVQATYALPPGQLRAVAVTDEPEGGLPKPSTTPIILGSVSE